MEYDEIKNSLTKKVLLTADNSSVFIGVLTNTESEFVTESGKEEVELDAGGYLVGIPLDEIKRIVPLTQDKYTT